MNHFVFRVSLVVLLAGGCTPSPVGDFRPVPANVPHLSGVTFTGGDGTSCDDAVVIDARSEIQGVGAESYWLSVAYPDFRKSAQALVMHDGRPHDIITVVGRETDASVDLCFDISSFFGKF